MYGRLLASSKLEVNERWRTKVEAEFDVYVPANEDPIEFHKALSHEKKILLAYVYAEESVHIAGELAENKLEMDGFLTELEMIFERGSEQQFLTYAAKLTRHLITEYKIEDIKQHLEEVYHWVTSASPSAIARIKRFAAHADTLTGTRDEARVSVMVSALSKCRAPLTTRLFFTRLPEAVRHANINKSTTLFYQAIEFPNAEMMAALLSQLDCANKQPELFVSCLLLSVIEEMNHMLGRMQNTENNLLDTKFGEFELHSIADNQLTKLKALTQIVTVLLRHGANVHINLCDATINDQKTEEVSVYSMAKKFSENDEAVRAFGAEGEKLVREVLNIILLQTANSLVSKCGY